MSIPPVGGSRERNPRGQGERLRAEIVNAAASLLDEAGSEDAVTLRAVARRAGISAPSIYRHFRDPQAILLAVAQGAFDELDNRLMAARDAEYDDPIARLTTTCQAYLTFAEEHPSPYRVMFGGLWNAVPTASQSVSEADIAALGQEALGVLTACLADCITAGASTSTAPDSDAVALWLGLHGLAHQRTASTAFPWPRDIELRIIHTLAHLRPPAT